MLKKPAGGNIFGKALPRIAFGASGRTLPGQCSEVHNHCSSPSASAPEAGRFQTSFESDGYRLIDGHSMS